MKHKDHKDDFIDLFVIFVFRERSIRIFQNGFKLMATGW